MGWFDWLKPKKQEPPLPPDLAQALQTPPRLLNEPDPDEPPRGPTLVLPRSSDPDDVRQALTDIGLDPEVVASVDLELGLVVLTIIDPDQLRELADQLGWIGSVEAFRLLDDDDPVTVRFAMRAADAYDAVGLGSRLVSLQRHSDEAVRTCASQLDRQRQMASALAQRARKKGKKKKR